MNTKFEIYEYEYYGDFFQNVLVITENKITEA